MSGPPAAVTVTFAVAVVEPAVLVAVSVYVVVVVGVTLVEPLAELDVKPPGVIAMLVAADVAQLSVLLDPELMPVGFAAKELIVGIDCEPFPVDELDPQPVRPAQASRMKTSDAFFRRYLSALGIEEFLAIV